MKDGVRTFNSFLKEGLIEYLDVNEENNALVSLSLSLSQSQFLPSSFKRFNYSPISLKDIMFDRLLYMKKMLKKVQHILK